MKVESVVVEAYDVYREILAQADRLQSNLVVMGTHGRSGFERLFLGSTAEKVLRKARCPVMTVPPKAPDAMASGLAPFKRIVCGIDFSKSSHVALDYAMSLAQENGAALAVVHVIEIHPMYVDFAPPAAIDLHAWTEQATSRLHQTGSRPSALGLQRRRTGTRGHAVSGNSDTDAGTVTPT